ncbi:hypothetical protein BOV90_03500 [Solemya velum gill symbiont]|uniref:Uncharacterized protein n=2 Tax=Solemya velum gill symbiont TaxID=2340 RepID=A0A0B0H9T6_SOVGS|nr:hypothetical protein [Solemya velum gill symbiont]KHF24649.1 hypothetical protein JV46_06780 [Solemya velum gill symbiont]OOY34051.1 hypothetical protein BOV88_11895 [Solemya velum gill symbiont]OOY36713.1 hypothetical protein BOV89_11340 [Solemya velum gill symbiont]OOY40518.1 hypothetical protein BOV90_03500 [Solemya velum gill symbiont]OOY41921.1 hypothetical protein BOV91_08945 [Solemya velum gill symbiont]
MRKLFIIAIILFPPVVYANVVWPALYLEIRLFSWWAIGLGLLVEFFYVKWLFALSVKRSAIADLSANAASSIAGILLIPLAGIAWEFFPASIYQQAFDWGTFNPVTWVATFILGCFINAVIEGAVYKKWFAPHFRYKSREFLWLLVANAISVGAAYISFLIVPLKA